MNVIKHFVLTVLAGFVLIHANAQETWNLDQCIQYALKNNIQYKREKLKAETTGNLFLNSKMQLLPSANAFAGASQNWGTTFSYDVLQYVDQKNLDGNFGLGLRMDLFRGFSNINNIGQYKYNLLANMQDVEKMKNNITFEIVAAYLQILLNQQLLRLADNQLDVTRQQVDRMQSLVDVGNQPMGKLLEIKAQEALEQSTRTSANNDLDLSYLKLSQLLFLDSVGTLKIEEPVDLDVDESRVLRQVGEVYREALGAMPGIKSAEYNLESRQKRLSSARGSRYPSLTAQFYDYTRFNELAVHPTLYDNDPSNDQTNYPYIEQIKDFRYRQFTLNLSIPVFNNWSVNTNVSNSKIAVSDAEMALDQAKLDLYRSIQEAHANALAALEKYRSGSEAVASQEEAFEYARQKFEVGMVNSVDYNIAKNNLTRAQSDLLQAKYQYIFRSMLLDFYAGRPISL